MFHLSSQKRPNIRVDNYKLWRIPSDETSLAISWTMEVLITVQNWHRHWSYSYNPSEGNNEHFFIFENIYFGANITQVNPILQWNNQHLMNEMLDVTQYYIATNIRLLWPTELFVTSCALSVIAKIKGNCNRHPYFSPINGRIRK